MEKWYKPDWSIRWWHFSIGILWSNWAIGLLFDSGRRWTSQGEKGIMILLPLVVIRIFWNKSLFERR